MTIKEQIVEALRADGYDFVTACEEASRAIKEANALASRQEITFITKKRAFTVRKN